MNNRWYRTVACLLVAVLGISAQATALFQDTQDRDEKQDPPPSLDDLLGLETDKSDVQADEAARAESERELQRRLDEKEITDAFLVALDKMATSATRLGELFDTGLATQRIQQDILAKLDQLIDKARQMQSLGQASASRSSSSQRSRSQNPGQRKNQANNSRRRDGTPQDSQAGNPPPRQEGDIHTILQEGGVEWGNLPERIRQELLQGRNDKFSSMYRRLTEEYYKRLAEEGSQ